MHNEQSANSDDLESTISEFMVHCEAQGLSTHTIKAYRQDLAKFHLWVRHSRAPSYVDHVLISDWVGDQRKHENAPASIRRRVASLRVFFKWLEQSDRLNHNPFHKVRLSVKLPKRLPKNLNSVELRALFAAPISFRADINSVTLRLALEILITTGIRVAELCSITLQDIDVDAKTIRIKGKGNRERRVFLVDESIEKFIAEYLDFRVRLNISHSTLLFTSTGEAATPSYIRRQLDKRSNALGLSRKITPHMFRHTAATQLLERGLDIRYVQRLLGHSSISTTEIYTHVSDTSLKDAVCRLSPRRSF